MLKLFSIFICEPFYLDQNSKSRKLFFTSSIHFIYYIWVSYFIIIFFLYLEILFSTWKYIMYETTKTIKIRVMSLCDGALQFYKSLLVYCLQVIPMFVWLTAIHGWVVHNGPIRGQYTSNMESSFSNLEFGTPNVQSV